MNWNTIGTNLVKASPYISFGLGVGCIGGALFTCFKATSALGLVLDEYESEKKELDLYLENVKEDGAVEDEKEFVAIEVNHKKESRKLGFRTFGRICKLYAPTAGFTIAGIGFFGYSMGKYRGLYLTAAGAFSELSETFDEYREVVREDVGEEKELQYYYGGTKEKITVEKEDPETGKTKKSKIDILTDATKGEFVYRWKRYDWQTGEGSSQYDDNPWYGQNYIVEKVKQFQHNLNAGRAVNFDRFLDEMGYEECNRKGDRNQLMRQIAKEHMAGWLPGDTIECGLEEKFYNQFKDVRDFVDGNSPEVTLRFNPRRDIIGITGIIKDGGSNE